MGFIPDIYVRLDRASEHLKYFDTEVLRYIKDKPYEFTHDFYSKWGNTYEMVSRIRIRQHPPLRLSAIFGEILFDIRSVLDHFVYQLALDNGRTGRDLNGIEFPIFDNREKFLAIDSVGVTHAKGRIWTSSGLYKIRSIDPDAQAVIESLQPYHGGDSILLWRLQEFSTIDKHRHLHMLSPYLGEWRVGRPAGDLIEPFDEREFQVLETELLAVPPLEDGAIVARFQVAVADGFDFKVRVHHTVTNDVLLYELGLRISAAQFLAGLEGFVRKAVFPQLTQFLK